MKKIAVITGASSGMGRRFAETVQEFGTYDEIWAIARRVDRLEELKNHTAFPVRTISLDLSDPASYETYAALLREEQPEVGLLINASGFGKFRAVMDTPLEVNLNMVDLNCKAVMALCQLTVPYMPSGSQIINIASVAAFQPIPYINVYGATKALVLHYSRALNRELKKQGVHVMAVCPFWTKTEFFDRAVASDEKPDREEIHCHVQARGDRRAGLEGREEGQRHEQMRLQGAHAGARREDPAAQHGNGHLGSASRNWSKENQKPGLHGIIGCAAPVFLFQVFSLLRRRCPRPRRRLCVALSR